MEKRIHLASLLICLLVIIGSLIILRPHWGLMDDASLAFKLIPSMEEEGIFRGAWRYGMEDIGWGMFRPIYPIMAYLVYKPGLLIAPWVTYVITAIFSISVVVGFAFVSGRILKIRWQHVLLVNAAFFYQYDLLQHPSLQEKIILLFGLGFFYSALLAPRRWMWPLVMAFTLFGFASKASFLIYFGAGFFVLLGRLLPELKERRICSWILTGAVALMGAAAVLALGKIASQGAYTTQWNPGKIFSNLLSPHGPLFLLPMIAAAWMFFREWRKILKRPQDLFPLAGLTLYLCIFLPWGIGGYVQSLAGPLIAPLLCQLAAYYLKDGMRRAFFLSFSLLAVVVCSYRVPTMFLRLSDLGQIVGNSQQILPQGQPIHMPCMEGADSMRTYLQRAGHQGMEVKFVPSLPQSGVSIWLYDNAMCPFPGRVMEPPGCVQDPLFRSKWKNSYRVVRMNCSS